MQMWLALFSGLLQMVLELLSNARSCGIGAIHDVTLTRMSGIKEGEFVTPRSHIRKMRRSLDRVIGL
jgi:hypothetical protein